MKTDELDELITQALTKEEADYYRTLEEESVPDMVLGLYKGKLAWMAVLTMVIIMAAFAFTVYCGIKFMNAASVEMMLKWGAGGFLGLIMTTMLKVWNWMQMDKNTLVRQIKHLEFQVSVLAAKLHEK